MPLLALLLDAGNIFVGVFALCTLRFIVQEIMFYAQNNREVTP
jgi:hypothetical protein